MRYLVVIEEGSNSFGAYVPDLPGCVAVGESRMEVLQLIQEAIEFHLESIREDGLSVPLPHSYGEFFDISANYKEKLPVYEKVNTGVFRGRMEDSFPSIYLNCISIIQGIALGLLCEEIFKKLTSPEKNIFTAFLDNPIKYIYIIMSLGCIICILYEYNWLVGTYRWSQKIQDTLIPIFLGFFEIGAILSFDNPSNWWLYTTCLNTIAVLGFINTRINTKRNMFDNRAIYSISIKNSEGSIIIMALAILITLIPTMTLNIENIKTNNIIMAHQQSIEILSFIFYIIAQVTLVARDCSFIKDLHDKLDLID
ncbi:MAG: type II toxin-antitoxin system HicB family antitoxin [Candidatus Methylumidiphilus sp.]